MKIGKNALITIGLVIVLSVAIALFLSMLGMVISKHVNLEGACWVQTGDTYYQKSPKGTVYCKGEDGFELLNKELAEEFQIER